MVIIQELLRIVLTLPYRVLAVLFETLSRFVFTWQRVVIVCNDYHCHLVADVIALQESAQT